MAQPNPSMAGWNTSADPHSASATSPTTSPDPCWNPAASDRNYTLDSEEPDSSNERILLSAAFRRKFSYIEADTCAIC